MNDMNDVHCIQVATLDVYIDVYRYQGPPCRYIVIDI